LEHQEMGEEDIFLTSRLIWHINHEGFAINIVEDGSLMISAHAWKRFPEDS